MSTRPHPADRGLAAVARVREVRETDSRIGLQQMLAEQASVAGRLAALEQGLANAAVPAVTTPAALLADRTALTGAGVLIGETRTALDHAQVLTAESRARWTTDKTRLAAVEHLLERRAAGRRTAAARAEARDADDLAGQAWARNRAGARR
ncbi:flagellar FliJ family protein [Nocardioides caeni]|uniref:Flagellar FliJ protein n=1 Tax=Nocardioides caeni TaxID=574700 RepID=A0A4S8NDT0_9ACTN|nr:flagellar FliJ family protein [Nocardioides caeni]THV14707.1 hypothetical protein E9934_08625 [Nocardioides caeni]